VLYLPARAANSVLTRMAVTGDEESHDELQTEGHRAKELQRAAVTLALPGW